MMFISIIMGILFFILGIVIPKVNQNHFLGIRLSWTLESEENWKATHSFASKIWIVTGISFFVCAYFQSDLFFFILLILSIFIPILYSYIFYRKQLIQQKTNKVQYHKVSTIFSIFIFIFVVISLFIGHMKVNFYETNFEIETPVWTNYVVEYNDIEDISLQKDSSNSIRIGGLGNLKVSMGSFESDEFGKYTRYTYNSCDTVIVLRVNGTYVLLNDIDEQTTKILYEQMKSRVG